MSYQGSFGQWHAWFLKAVQPVPAVGGVTDVEELQHTHEHVGVVVRQRAGQQAVNVVSLNVKTETRAIYCFTNWKLILRKF